VVCRCLRYVAHTLGATLQFYSLKESGLVKKAKDLLNHHGFGAPPVYVIFNTLDSTYLYRTFCIQLSII
jgi:hypothetical protein